MEDDVPVNHGRFLLAWPLFDFLQQVIVAVCLDMLQSHQQQT
jgi:hypothetical protein